MAHCLWRMSISCTRTQTYRLGPVRSGSQLDTSAVTNVTPLIGSVVTVLLVLLVLQHPRRSATKILILRLRGACQRTTRGFKYTPMVQYRISLPRQSQVRDVLALSLSSSGSSILALRYIPPRG